MLVQVSGLESSIVLSYQSLDLDGSLFICTCLDITKLLHMCRKKLIVFLKYAHLCRGVKFTPRVVRLAPWKAWDKIVHQGTNYIPNELIFNNLILVFNILNVIIKSSIWVVKEQEYAYGIEITSCCSTSFFFFFFFLNSQFFYSKSSIQHQI